jgi:hypothetical protein
MACGARARGRAIRRSGAGLLFDGKSLPRGVAHATAQPLDADAPAQWGVHAGLQPQIWGQVLPFALAPPNLDLTVGLRSIPCPAPCVSNFQVRFIT